jgi:signal transduction histidine kinase
MPRGHSALRFRRLRHAISVVGVWLVGAMTPVVNAQAISNLLQLTQSLISSNQIIGHVDLEVTVCDASRPKVGVLIARDETGFELLQLGSFAREISPGQRIRIRGNSCLLRKREMGVEISAVPVVNNDGLHSWTAASGEATLPAGKIPLRLEWFNYWRSFGLDVLWASSNESPRTIEASNLWHTVINESGETNFLPGLRVECFEGSWESAPDFNLLHPVRAGVVTNFNLSNKPRDERVGMRYAGYLEVPRAGHYQFSVWSDDGSLLFLGGQNVSVASLGSANVPTPKPAKLLTGVLSNLNDRCWITVEGRVSFVSPIGEGVRFDLRTDQHVVAVRLADTAGLNLAALPNTRVRVTGLGHGALTLDETLMIGRLFSASAKDLAFAEPQPQPGQLTLPIRSVAQVQSLPIASAGQSLAVRIRGTVTGAKRTSQEHWMTFQDDTRGIFVRLDAISNAAPAAGELWEVEGHSGAGDFAPIIIADKITRLGEGLLPSPVTPTWTELLNGSRDVQWAELKGLVSDIHSNTISLRLPEGRLDLELEGFFESDLSPFLKTVVRIRGVLYAVWDASREVRVGRVMMRNSTICVDASAPTDPFDAVVRTPRELLRFDAQASVFRPVKVRGQIVYADSAQLFLEENGAGLRLLPVEKPMVRPGDLVEAVGYPDIGGRQLQLREVLLRKTGKAPLPPPRRPDESGLSQMNLNSLRVRVEGKLLGWHSEAGSPVLEMLFGERRFGESLYLARIANAKTETLSLRPGSRLALEGVYVGRGHNPVASGDDESFELLMNSPADITILSQPSWWTPPRVLALSGVLVVVLVITVIWNTQLRRVVEQRTTQLEHEIHERERLERQHAIETERSRIARDLHDDLGSNLTEISVLASTGQLPQTAPTSQSGLFQAISTRARSLIAALDVIVWAVDPEDNSLQSLADYLTGYTTEYFTHTQIACRFKVPVSLPPITLEGRVRHDLLMTVKEALNNVVRHAEATELEFRLDVVDGSLEIDIADNGKGVEPAAQSSGHGLKNLSARLRSLGGQCTVEPRTSGGTIVKIRLPLAESGRG